MPPSNWYSNQWNNYIIICIMGFLKIPTTIIKDTRKLVFWDLSVCLRIISQKNPRKIELSDIFSLIKWEQCGRYFLTVEMWGDSSTK